MTRIPAVLAGPRRAGLCKVLAAILVQAAAAAAGAFATRALFGALHMADSLPLTAALILAGSGFGIAMARVLAQLAGERVGQSYALAIRCALWDHGTRASASSVAARRQGYTSLRFVGDMSAFRNWAGRGLPRLMSAMVLIPATLAVLGALHMPFLIAVAPIYGLALAIILIGGLTMPAKQRQLRAKRASLAADMAERMPVAPHLGALGRRRTEHRNLFRKSEKMIRSALSATRLRASLRAVCDAAAGLAALAVILSGAHSGAQTATIAAGLAALGLALAPMRQIAGVWTMWSAFRVAHAKVQSLLDRPSDRASGPGRTLPSNALSVTMRGVSSGPLQGLDLEVPAGAVLRLTGQNGAGKSHLLALLAGLETPKTGTIALSGMPLPEIAQGSLRRSVMRIADDPVILRGSLRRALALGLDNRPDDRQLREAALACGLGSLLARDGGLDSTVSEAGRTLSPGERTKIALARAMLGSPRLVLIDDARARLDRVGQAALTRWLKGLEATTIIADPGNAPQPDCSFRRDLDNPGPH